MLVDSHCHLNFPEFEGKLAETLERAKVQGVTFFLTVNTRLSETQSLIDITQAFPNMVCSVGIHPHDSKDYSEEAISDQIRTFAKHAKVVALGETGLDYHYDNSPREEQRTCFKRHVDLSEELNLPLIIHTREADEDTISLLKNRNVKGVFHCFSGSEALAKEALDLGFYISFSGIITFKKALDLQEVVKMVPLNRILVETDSPFLSPIPHRGTPNEPGFTRLVAEKVAELKGITLEEVAEQTTKNFFALFHKAHV